MVPWNEEPAIWKRFAEHIGSRYTEEVLRSKYIDCGVVYKRYKDFRAGFMAGGNY